MPTHLKSTAFPLDFLLSYFLLWIFIQFLVKPSLQDLAKLYNGTTNTCLILKFQSLVLKAKFGNFCASLFVYSKLQQSLIYTESIKICTESPKPKTKQMSKLGSIQSFKQLFLNGYSSQINNKKTFFQNKVSVTLKNSYLYLFSLSWFVGYYCDSVTSRSHYICVK